MILDVSGNGMIRFPSESSHLKTRDPRVLATRVHLHTC